MPFDVENANVFSDSWPPARAAGFVHTIRILKSQPIEIASEPQIEVGESLRGEVHLAPADYCKEAMKLEQVKAIMWKDEDGITYIWAAISPLEEDVAFKLYDLEDRLYKKYPNATFNFYVFEAKIPVSVPEDFDLLYEKT